MLAFAKAHPLATVLIAFSVLGTITYTAAAVRYRARGGRP